MRKLIACLFLSLLFLPGLVAAAEETGKIPEVGKINGPATTADITAGMGVFADIGKFILNYAVQIAVFIMVLTVVILAVRGSWARSHNKVEEAANVQQNQKDHIVDGIVTMVALLFIFYILAPFIKSFIPA